MTKKRELENWLSAFQEWTLPRSEAPESMLKWAGLFTLAAVMRRKVLWPRKLMGGYEIFPSLYIVFVGRPAVVRKSTTVGYAQDLLVNYSSENTNGVTFAGDVTSYSKMLSGLAESPDSSLAVVASEFGSLVQTTPEETYTILTDLFDNRKKYDWSTWAHGDKEIKQPVVNLIAATTPAWIAGQPSEYFVGGGFASRILFLFEEKPRQRKLYYDHLDQGRLKVLEAQLGIDLRTIGEVEGEFKHDSKRTHKYVDEWYDSLPIESEDERLDGYYGRKHIHAHKVAGLISLAERNDRRVTRKHFDEAISLLDYLEARMSKAFSTLGTNPFTAMMDELLEYVKTCEKTDIRRVAGRFYNSGYTLEQLKSALAFLCTGGKIKASGALENPSYTFKGD